MVADTAPAPAQLIGPPDTATAAAGSAEVRLSRLFARFIATGYLFYLPLMIGVIAAQRSVMAPWWTPFAVAVVFGPPIAMGPLSFHPDVRWCRYAAAVAALGYLTAALTWFPAWRHELIPADAWISGIPGLAGLAAALAWGPVRTIGLLTGTVIAVQWINHICRLPGHNAEFVPDILFALSFCLLYVSAALMAMRTGRLLDRTRVHAHAVAGAAAAAEARKAQRIRFNALLHDWVMSTLLAAAKGVDRVAVRDQAGLTLAKLDDTHPGTVTHYRLPAAAAYFRTTIADVDGSAVVQVVLSDDPAAELPAEPVQILSEAISEAVRNSVRHAGAGATRSLTLTLAPGRIGAVCADDGVGFDPAVVPVQRLGLAVSIIARVRGLRGGDVELHTRPGTGTVVRLGWREQAA